MIFVTGGASFIGSNFVLDWLAANDEPVLNLENLVTLQGNPNHVFVQSDLGDRELVDRLLAEHKPRAPCSTSLPNRMSIAASTAPRR